MFKLMPKGQVSFYW